MKLTLLVVVIVAVTVSFAEELETRKTVKKAAAVGGKNEINSRTDAPEGETIKVETVMETTTPSAPSKVPATTTTVPASTKAQETTKIPESTKVTELTKAPEATTTKAQVTTPEASITTATATEATTQKLPEQTATHDIDDVQLATEAPGSSSSSVLTIEGPINESSESESEEDNPLPFPPQITQSGGPRRRVIYVNEKQSGKVNVHLELSDISVVVIPSENKNSASESALLSLLFKSAQKSKDAKKKKEEIVSSSEIHDDYSKFKQVPIPSEESNQLGTTGIPLVESRAPYKVDISSTMGQQSQPAIDITPNAHQHSGLSAVPQFQQQFARSPIMQLLKPIPFTIQTAPGQVPRSNRIFKRSIDSRLLGLDAEIPRDSENSVINDGLTESFLNSVDNGDYIDSYESNNDSEFVLLGATENCGPGRKRNSYQICVAAADME
jgi:hypothetical protein